MSRFYKLSWGKHINKLINLNTVSSFYQHKNLITITYNQNASEGVIFFGSGFINQGPHKEIITYDSEDDATNEMQRIEIKVNNDKKM